MPGLNLIQNAIATLKTIMPSYNHILRELINNDIEKKDEINKKIIIKFEKKISIKNIEFSYPKTKSSASKKYFYRNQQRRQSGYSW